MRNCLPNLFLNWAFASLRAAKAAYVQRQQCMSNKFLYQCLAIVLALASAVTHGAQPTVVISKLTPHLRVKSVDLLSDGITAHSAVISGVLVVQASVRYGWFEGFESPGGLPLLEIELSEAERRKLPYLAGWTPGYFSSFSIKNIDEIATKIFDAETLRSVREKRLLGAERKAKLALSRIEFGSDCGMHFIASAKIIDFPRKQVAVALPGGLEGHC